MTVSGRCYPYTIQSKLIDNLATTNNRGVFGIACLPNHVYIITHAGQIDVYVKKGFRYEQTNGIPTPDLPGPSDIAACQLTQRLYVSDAVIDRIWMLCNPLSDNPTFERFAKVTKANGLFVASDGRVVVVTGIPCSILVYLPSADLIVRLPLVSTIIKDPYQAVLDSYDNFIVCSGLYSNQKHSVIKISQDGKILVRIE